MRDLENCVKTMKNRKINCQSLKTGKVIKQTCCKQVLRRKKVLLDKQIKTQHSLSLKGCRSFSCKNNKQHQNDNIYNIFRLFITFSNWKWSVFWSAFAKKSFYISKSVHKTFLMINILCLDFFFYGSLFPCFSVFWPGFCVFLLNFFCFGGYL